MHSPAITLTPGRRDEDQDVGLHDDQDCSICDNSPAVTLAPSRPGDDQDYGLPCNMGVV